MAQSVKRLTSAQVMISRFVSSSPTSGSVLTAPSLEPASDSVSLSLSAPPPAHALSLSVSKINKTLKKIFFKNPKQYDLTTGSKRHRYLYLLTLCLKEPMLLAVNAYKY